MVAKWDRSFVVLGDVLGDVFPQNGITGLLGFVTKSKVLRVPVYCYLKFIQTSHAHIHVQ